MDCHLEFVFTDGHAVSSLSSFYGVGDVEGIETIIDQSAIRNRYWRDEQDMDLKRRKEAEFLVLGDIPASAILGFVVYNQEAKDVVIKNGAQENSVVIKPDYYF